MWQNHHLYKEILSRPLRRAGGSTQSEGHLNTVHVRSLTSVIHAAASPGTHNAAGAVSPQISFGYTGRL